jgi:cobalt-zinc-cadmium efflux system protein
MRSRKGDLNIRGAFLHMAADALVSLGVVVGGALYLWQGWDWIDPMMSLAIAAVIVVGTWNLFRQSLHLLFDGVPEAIDPQAVRAALLALPQVRDVHDLHIWAMSTSHNAMTAHLVLADGAVDTATVLFAAEAQLHEEFELQHVTLQLETPAYAEHCGLRGTGDAT